MRTPNPAQRRDWLSNNWETRFGGQPHNLHRLARRDDGDTEWACRCGQVGTAPTADDAVTAHRDHTRKATP